MSRTYEPEARYQTSRTYRVGSERAVSPTGSFGRYAPERVTERYVKREAPIRYEERARSPIRYEERTRSPVRYYDQHARSTSPTVVYQREVPERVVYREARYQEPPVVSRDKEVYWLDSEQEVQALEKRLRRYSINEAQHDYESLPSRRHVVERDEYIEKDTRRPSEYAGELVVRRRPQHVVRDHFETDYRKSTGSFARYDDVYDERIREEVIIPAPEREVEREREIIRTTYAAPPQPEVERYHHHRSHHRSESRHRSSSRKPDDKEKQLKKELKKERKKVKKLLKEKKKLEESSSESEEEFEKSVIAGEGLTIVRRTHHSGSRSEEYLGGKEKIIYAI